MCLSDASLAPLTVSTPGLAGASPNINMADFNKPAKFEGEVTAHRALAASKPSQYSTATSCDGLALLTGRLASPRWASEPDETPAWVQQGSEGSECLESYRGQGGCTRLKRFKAAKG